MTVLPEWSRWSVCASECMRLCVPHEQIWALDPQDDGRHAPDPTPDLNDEQRAALGALADAHDDILRAQQERDHADR